MKCRWNAVCIIHRMTTLKLSINLVPSPLWGFNLRKFIPASRWMKVRKLIIADRGLRCETCGVEVEESKNLNAHEVWEYDETREPAVATLVRIELACKSCHSCEHWGRLTNLVAQGIVDMSEVNRLIAHFCKVNDVKKSAFEKHRKAAFTDFDRRARLEWRVDWGQFTSLVLEYHQNLPTTANLELV